jgi:hypothetical protein
MLIFQLPQRTVLLEKDLAEINPPYEVVLKVQLGPEEFFGDVPLSGKLRELQGSQQVQMRVSLFEGMRKPIPMEGDAAEKFSYSGLFSNVPISFDGSTAVLSFIVHDLSTLGGFVQEVTERLAGSFAACCIVPVAVTAMTGTVNEVPFTVRYDSSMHFQVGAIDAVKRQLDLVLPYAREIPRQIISAQRYLAQNFLLEYVVDFASQVTGERILNLCKSFESLIPPEVLGGDARKQDDRIRQFLRSWAVQERYADVLISLRKLRSSLDVAHIRRSPISTEAHESIDNFLPLVERCIQALITMAIKKSIDNPSTYPPETNEIEDISALRYIRSYTNIPPPQNGDLTIFPKELETGPHTF